jgi:hypothetical protein
MSSLGREADILLPVHYDVYLKKRESALSLRRGSSLWSHRAVAGKLPMDVQGIELLWAYELDTKGGIKTRWPLPVDASPLAIDGNRLIIQQFSVEEVVFVNRCAPEALDGRVS